MNYERNYLTQVICRLEFAAKPPLPAPDSRPEFTRAIAGEYPEIVGQTLFMVNFDPTATRPGVEGATPTQRWIHRKAKGAKSFVVLDPAYFSLEWEAKGFTTFAEFRQEMVALLVRLRESFPNMSFSRVGLRYVNEVKFDEGNPFDWEGLIAQPLVNSVLAAVPVHGELTRSMHQVTTRRNDIQQLFTYGMHNPDFPGLVAQRDFILDIDASKSGIITYDELQPLIDEMNIRCETIFEASIEDGLREKMGVIHA